MLLTIALGIVLGAIIGGFIGRARSCESGACPLTANPTRGAFFGGLLGMMITLSIFSGHVKEGNPPNQISRPVAPGNPAITEISTMDIFKQKVLQSPGKIVVDFYASWCEPCKEYGPLLEKIADEKQQGVAFARVDVDAAEEIARKYDIEAMPTTLIFENGKEINRLMGIQTKEMLEQAMKT